MLKTKHFPNFVFRKYKNNVDNQELIMLLEGTCHMHINSEKGKIQKVYSMTRVYIKNMI